MFLLPLIRETLNKKKKKTFFFFLKYYFLKNFIFKN